MWGIGSNFKCILLSFVLKGFLKQWIDGDDGANWQFVVLIWTSELGFLRVFSGENIPNLVNSKYVLTYYQ